MGLIPSQRRRHTIANNLLSHSANRYCCQFGSPTPAGIGTAPTSQAYRAVSGRVSYRDRKHRRRPGVPWHRGDPYEHDNCSPCIDAGNNDALPDDVADLDDDGDRAEPIPEDLAGAARRVNDTGKTDTGAPGNDAPYVDMGAYEHQDTSSCE